MSIKVTPQLIAEIRRRLQPYQGILKWDRNQLRHPSGSSEGGRFAKGGARGGAGSIGERIGRHFGKLGFKPVGTAEALASLSPNLEDRGGNASYASIMNAPTGTGFTNQPRGVGLPEPPPPEMTAAATSAKIVASLTTGKVVDSEPMGDPGVNVSLKVKLEDGQEGVYKPEGGETWTGGFSNTDIPRFIKNRDFSLAEREAVAFEVSDALGLGLVPETVLRTELEVEGLDLTQNENAVIWDTSELEDMYKEYKEKRLEQAIDEVGEEFGRLYEAAQDEHVKDVRKRVGEVEGIWNELKEGYPESTESMGELDPLEVLKDANVDMSWRLTSAKKATLEKILREKLEEGYRELGEVDEDAAREDLDRDQWIEDHQDTENQLYEGKIQDFDSWRESQGYNRPESGEIKNQDAPHPNGGSLQAFRPGDSYGTMVPEEEVKLAVLDYVIGTMDRHGGNIMYSGGKPVAIDNGYSMPASNTPDGFTFRSRPVDRWLNEGDTDVPAAQREPILKALNDTNWQALLDRHPSMNAQERQAFLGRIENMKEAMSYDGGLSTLWHDQNLTR